MSKSSPPNTRRSSTPRAAAPSSPPAALPPVTPVTAAAPGGAAAPPNSPRLRQPRPAAALAQVFDELPIAVALADAETGRFLAVNRAALTLLGTTREAFLALTLGDLHADIGWPPAAARWTCRRGDTTIAIELAPGTLDFAGRPARTLLARDVTAEAAEREQAEADARRSLSLLRSTLESTTDGLLAVDLDGRMVSYNQRFLHMWNIPPEVIEAGDDQAAVGHVLAQLAEPAAFAQKVRELYAHPDAESFDVLHFLDGRVFERYSLPQRLDGRAIGRVWSFRDVTERKHTEDSLRRLQRDQTVIFNSVPAMIWYKDLNNHILRANRMAAESIGLRVTEVENTSTYDLYPEHADQYLRDDREVIETGQPKLGIVETLSTKHGERWIQTDKVPYRDEHGKIVGVIAFSLDVTERLSAEIALQERLRFERLITSISARFINLAPDQLDDAIYDAIRAVGEFAVVDSAFAYLFGGAETTAHRTRAWYSGELVLSARTAETLAGRHGGWAARHLTQIGYLNLPRVEDLGEEATADRQLLRDSGVRSLLLVPLLFGGSCRGVLGFCTRHVEKRWSEDSIALLRIAAEMFASAIERRQAEQALRASERRYRLLFERNLAGVFRNSPTGRILDCNDAYAKILGYGGRLECIGGAVNDLYYDAQQRDSILNRLRARGSVTNEEIALRKVDGSSVWVLANLTWLDRRDGEAEMIEGTLVDITQRKAAESQIVYQAYHDALTDLPNRLLFHERLTQALAQARRHAHGLAVLFMDLDEFKVVNDTLGHTAGDRLLQEVAERLARSLRTEDTVARVGGDEFTILLPHITLAEDAARVAQVLLAAVSLPAEIDDQRIFLTTSIGISIFPSDGSDAEGLLTSADLAMYRAKDLGGNGYQMCTPAMSAKALVRLTLEQELRLALERDELTLYYQPQIDLAHGRTRGFEALLRWRHSTGEIILPDRFIAVAEEARLIVPIGEWVIATACRQLREWQERGLPAQQVAVNLSPRQFQQKDLVPRVAAILEQSRLAPACLTLEITETAAMQNVERTVETVAALREMGIRIAIDDFGTGHAALIYLQQFDVDTLKIDRAFVAGLATQRGSRAIVNAIVDLAHGLDLAVVAEGVETEPQRQFLAARGCDAYQGYLVSPPVPPADAEHFLRPAPPAS